MTEMEEMLKILRVPPDYKDSHGTVMIDADTALKAMKAWGDKRFNEALDLAAKKAKAYLDQKGPTFIQGLVSAKVKSDSILSLKIPVQP